MDFEEKYQKDKEKYHQEIYRTQKVKLYKLKYWIFDFAGVMAEAPNILTKLLKIIDENLGTSLSKEDPYVKKTRRQLSSGRLSAREFLERIIQHYYISHKKEVKEVDVEPFLEIWFEKYSQLVHLTPEMEEIVERLHKAGYHVSLMSNTYKIHAKSNELKGFFNLFDKVYLSNELRMRKPDIEKYKYVLNDLNAKPNEAFFIDDKLINLVPAKKLGMNVIRFQSFELFNKYLSDLGIEELTSEIREQIIEKYNLYKTTKKDYKKAKKDVKLIKKQIKVMRKEDNLYKIRPKYRKLEKELGFKKSIYKTIKSDYEHQKLIKKEVLKPRFKLEKPSEE